MPRKKDIMEQVGKTLTNLHEKDSLTQKKLGDILHISSNSISAYENGSRLPGLDIITAYACQFDVTIDYILGRSESTLSPSVMNEEFLAGVTVNTVVEKMQKLGPKQKEAFMMVLLNMSACAEFAKETGKGED